MAASSLLPGATANPRPDVVAETSVDRVKYKVTESNPSVTNYVSAISDHRPLPVEFFICIGDQPGLDYGQPRNADRQGFAAFGKVVSGMDVVRRINGLRADAPSDSDYTAGQILSEPVAIESVRRAE